MYAAEPERRGGCSRPWCRITSYRALGAPGGGSMRRRINATCARVGRSNAPPVVSRRKILMALVTHVRVKSDNERSSHRRRKNMGEEILVLGAGLHTAE